jgi:hypothetical protein
MICFVSYNLDPNTSNTRICVWTQASYKVGVQAEGRASPEHLPLYKLSVSLFTQFTSVQNDNINGIFGAGRKRAMISDYSVLYCSRNNSCDVITWLRPGQLRYRVSVPGKGIFFFSLQSFQTGSGVQPATWQSAREADSSPSVSTEVNVKVKQCLYRPRQTLRVPGR